MLGFDGIAKKHGVLCNRKNGKNIRFIEDKKRAVSQGNGDEEDSIIGR